MPKFKQKLIKHSSNIHQKLIWLQEGDLPLWLFASRWVYRR